MGSRLIVGCGYLGRYVARLWRANGHTVHGLVHTEGGACALAAEGVHAFAADITKPQTLPRLPPAETVVFSVSPERKCSADLHALYVEGLKNVLDRLVERPRRFILISTTGVFGEAVDGWIDEQTPPAPRRPAARALLAAEKLLEQHPISDCSVVLRLAGLYGPGRVAALADVRSGRPLAKDPHTLINLIHVVDAAHVITACDQAANPPRLLLVSDGNPVRRGEFYRYLAQLLKAPLPNFVQPPLNARPGASKRVSNRLMLDCLGLQLRYPSFREGLRALVETDGEPPP